MKKCQNVSVIVPALNEAQYIARLLQRLTSMPNVDEVIVCDGGSIDDTRAIASQLGVQVIDCLPNRGAQMNAGAQVACGEILWFLHADSFPPISGAQRMVAACNRENLHRVLDVRTKKIIGGNFRLRFNLSRDSSRNNPQRVAANTFATIARILRRFGVYYGDSGIWMRRDVFERIGGFESWPLFEDYNMARRLERFARQNGVRTTCIASPVVVSSRRFGTSARSATKLLLRWAKLQLLFWLGVAPETLAQMYRKK